MTNLDIAQRRLHNLHLSRQPLATPQAVVAWLGAVQAQDYPGARWALGLRIAGATEATIAQAYADGAILRTHLMRPTWHFVTPADIRWMLALTAPRVNAAAAYNYRQYELDDALFARSNAALTQALAGGKHLTRPELGAALGQAGITVGNANRFGLIMLRAELDGVVCNGPMRGKQFTYALLEERVPPARPLDREEALAILARRYFTSHGPATVRDFVWWSGLTTADARAGLALVGAALAQEVIDGRTYWFAPSPPPAADPAPTAYLLPAFDEYTVGYKDRSAVLQVVRAANLDLPYGGDLNYVIVIDGQLRGTWKRTQKKDMITLETSPFTPLTDAEARAFAAAVEHYSRFLGVPVTVPA